MTFLYSPIHSLLVEDLRLNPRHVTSWSISLRLQFYAYITPTWIYIHGFHFCLSVFDSSLYQVHSPKSPLPRSVYPISSSYQVHNRILGLIRTMTTQAQQKTYHKKATGQALNTVKKHAKEADLKLFGSCFW